MKIEKGNQPQAPQELVVPAGIKLNPGKKKGSIGISFRYNGEEIRETIKLSITQKNIDYVSRRRGEILNAIALGTFDYETYFPDSLKSRRARAARAKAQAESPAQITVEEMLGRYMLIAKKTVDHSSFDQYNSVCKKHILPQWSGWRVQDLTTKHLRDWILTFKQKKKTIDSILLPLRQALTLAYTDEIIPVNPFDKIEVHKLVSKEQKRSAHVIEPFDIDEINRILSFCDSDQEQRMFKFAFCTGTRPSEYIAMKWSDINFLRGKIHVTSTHVDGRTKKGGKTDASTRQIDMREGARHALKLQRTVNGPKSDLVFLNPRTGEPWTGDKQIRGRWRRILKKAEVNYRNPYQTRHTFASSLLMLDHNPLYVAGQLGHTTVAMVTKTYGRWIEGGLEGDKREKLQAMYAENTHIAKS